MSKEERAKKSRWKEWTVGGALTLATLGGGTYWMTRPGNPVPTRINVSAREFAERATESGAALPPIMQRLAELEALHEKTHDEAYRDAIRDQILLEAYPAIRAGTLPHDYQNALLDALETLYKPLAKERTLLNANIGVKETVQRGVDATNESTGTSLPRPNSRDSRVQLYEVERFLRDPEAVLKAGGRLPLDAAQQADLDRDMARHLEENTRLLETYATIEKLDAMAARGPLTIIGEQYLLDGLRKVSSNTQDYIVFYDAISGGGRIATQEVGAVRVTNGEDSIDLPLFRPADIVHVLPHALRNAGTYKEASHTEAMELQKAANAAFKAETPPITSPSR